MYIKKNVIVAAIASTAITVAAAILPVSWLPKGEDRANHDPLIVTNQDILEFTAFEDSSALVSRIAFGKPSKMAFSSSDESVCSVDQNGVVTAVGDGKATITVSTDAGDVANPVEKKVDVVVERAEQAVTTAWDWTGLSAGSQAQLGAESTSGLGLTYASSDENVAQVLPDGTVEALNPGTATISAIQPGDNCWQPADTKATVVVAEGNRDRIAALEPFFEAMRVQQQWSWDSVYGSCDGTIENSRVVGNCTTLPTASLQRVGLLKEPGCVIPHSKNVKAHPEYFERFISEKTPAQSVADGDLIVGDIVRTYTPLEHSMVYMGWDEKRNCPLWNTSGRAGGTQGSRPALMSRVQAYEKGIVGDILRIKTYTVNVSWEGSGIVGGGGEVMAKQDCTVTFDAQPGSTLSKLIIDGVEQTIEPDMRSYTFSEVLEPHSVEVVFS